jgi:putative DNA primase/helicase
MNLLRKFELTPKKEIMKGEIMSNQNQVNLAAIPKELQEIANWVTWRYEVQGGKRTKIPVNPKTGGNAMCNEPATWATFSEAVKYWKAHKEEVSGIGFALKNSPYAGLDLDDCRDPQTGEIEPWAAEIVAEMKSYTEVTPSGKGVRILVRGDLPPGGRRKGKIEMYDTGRILSVTGQHLKGTPTSIKTREKELKKLHARIFGVKGLKPASSQGLQSKAQKSPALADSDLIRRAMRAKNGEEFYRLWSGDWSGYDSRSEADFRLCSMLAFWTGKNPEEMDRLFRQSGLMRTKWDERRGDNAYGERTVQQAIQMTREIYSPRR